MTWRTVALALAALCALQAWRDCTRGQVAAPAPAVERDGRERGREPGRDPDRSPARAPLGDDDRAPPEPTGGLSIEGFQLPAWTAWLAPHAGEDLRAYRDRMLPIAQAVVAPHRERVARSRDEFAALAHLDASQRAELDAAARDAATAIEERVLGAVLAGDFAPATFKPMTGVAVARDVLDAVDRGSRRFAATLRDDQKAVLAQHPFDFGDYLVFATRWEDRLGLAN